MPPRSSNLRTFSSLSSRTRGLIQQTALAALIGAAGLGPLCAAPQDNPACGQFAWSIARELALFSDPNMETVLSGATLGSLPPNGVAVELQPHPTVDYALPPGREPKTEDSFGGVLTIANVPKAGAYLVTVSSEAWIDVIQNGRALASAAHTGKEGCPGVRKSLRFDLDAGPLTVQVSGVNAALIRLAILPAE